MSNTPEVKVPNIGDFDAVEVIEVLVKVGDSVSVDQSLITVESDKASMEIPSSLAGTITEIKVKIGDKVSEGSVVVLLAPPLTAAAPSAPSTPSTPSTSSTSSTPSAIPADSSVAADHECDLMVLGAGPGGYSAAFRAADLGLRKKRNNLIKQKRKASAI